MHASDIIGDITVLALLKNGSYIAAIIYSIQYLGFSPESLVIFAALMIIDVITGSIRSMLNNGGRSFKSSILSAGILAKCMLLLVPFTVGLTGKGVGFDLSVFVQSVVSVLILAEAYSILGNIHSSITGKEKQEFDAVAFILSKLRTTLLKVLKDYDK